MKYDLKKIMTKAWELYRKAHLKIDRFGEALHRAWAWFKVLAKNAKKVADKIAELGITEEVKTWFAWTLVGRCVKHEETAMFKVELDTPERGDGKTFLTAYFGYSQTDLAENVD